MQAHIAEASRHEPKLGPRHRAQWRTVVAQDFADTARTAKRAALEKSPLEKLRMTGDGPPYRKLGPRKVIYWPDVVQWLDARVRHSTSEAA